MRRRKPLDLSVIIVTYEMQREAPRTVHSFCRPYQQGIDDLRYEVLVVDNGSPTPLDTDAIESIASNVRVLRPEKPSPSPGIAANWAAEHARGAALCIVLDGARLATPGALRLGLEALALSDQTVATTPAWHLGPEIQTQSIKAGYDQAAEDELLRSIDWPSDGYRLFSIAAMTNVNPRAWFGATAESCCLFLSARLFARLRGYDPKFATPGGGFVSLDFFRRLMEHRGTQLVMLLGEGSFHQVHGGASSNTADPDTTLVRNATEYESIRGRKYAPPDTEPLVLGRVTQPAEPWVAAALGSEDLGTRWRAITSQPETD